jgi:predicted branched-subunit amino acid permease
MSSYWRGMAQSVPFALITMPFGMLFGILAAEAGLDLLEAVSFSAAVIAGAAQLTALKLLGENAPVLIAVISALAVNLRMAMYSIAITPHLGSAPTWKRALIAYFLVDATYALSHAEFEKKPDLPLNSKLAFYAGTVTAICLPWYPATAVGALIGDALPQGFDLGFAMPLSFIAIVAPMLRGLPQISAALVAIVLSLAFAWLPYNLGLIVGGLGGMMAGAQVELIVKRRVPT